MTTHKRYPVGTTYTGTEPPRYVPHMPRPAGLDTRPLAEADTWPNIPRYPVDPHRFGAPAPHRVRLTPTPTPAPTPEPLPVAAVPVRPAPARRAIWRPRHTRLGWRVRAVGWALVDLWGEMRLSCGWLGEVAFLTMLAACGAAVVVGVLLVVFALTGAGM